MQLLNSIKFRSLLRAFGIVLLLSVCAGGSTFVLAFDGEKSASTEISIHEVARQIRQYKSWQILDASPKQKATGIRYFRFKLLHNNGMVKVINIDPLKPNLRRLEK